MPTIRVNLIGVLLIISLLSLLVVQSFQTVQLYDQQSVEFQKRFNTTLETISLKHQRMEEIRKYLPVIDKDFSGRYKDILKEEFKNMLPTNESISIRDTVIKENGENKKYLIIQGSAYDSISGLTASQKVLARDIRELRDLMSSGKTMSGDSNDLAIQLDERVMQQIFRKAQFVNDIMLETFRNDLYENPTVRIDPYLLDTIIQNELKGKNLPSDFEFVITDMNNKPISFDKSPKRYKASLDTTETHTTQLFPGNFLDEKLKLHIKFKDQSGFLFGEIWGALAVNFSLAFVIILSMIIMFRTILSQKKLHEMKNNFISNMTHEFKTPISTISLACQALNDPDMENDPKESEVFVNMIKDENKRLELLVERILQAATIDRGELKLNKEGIILNELVQEAVSKARFRLNERGGNIELTMPNDFIRIQADRVHTLNVISNLLDNAIKYSNNSPEINVSLSNEADKISLTVTDKGIGMKKEHLNKIFDNLYRIPTGNVHNVKGFGLGLGYVKSIVDLHGWKITVTSKPDHGSSFTIEIV